MPLSYTIVIGLDGNERERKRERIIFTGTKRMTMNDNE